MKVSSGSGLPLGRVEEQHERLVGAELGLHLRDGHGRRARQRGVVREVLGEPPVDLGEAGVDGGEAVGERLLGVSLALRRLLALGGDEQLVLRLPFAHQVLPLAHQHGKLRRALGRPRRHLRERGRRLRALRPLRRLEHLRCEPAVGLRPCAARRWVTLTRPQNCQPSLRLSLRMPLRVAGEAALGAALDDAGAASPVVGSPQPSRSGRTRARPGC